MVLRGADAITLAMEGWPGYRRQIAAAARVDLWQRGRQQEIPEVEGAFDGGGLFMPDRSGATREYQDLASRAPAPWARLVVDALTQTMFVDGIYASNSEEPLRAWQSWQRNGMDARQIPLYRAAITHGVSYASCLPGRDRLTGDALNVMTPYSAKRMAAFWAEDSLSDEYPMFAIEADRRVTDGFNEVWFVTLWDEDARYYLEVKGDGYDRREWTYISYDEHSVGVTPIVRYSNQIDLDGTTMGEVEPIIPLLRRIDQSTFDRLIVQRFGAWKVRYATGLAKPDSIEGQIAQATRLKVEDLLINTSTDGRFGTLDATGIEGFIAATEADLRTLSAVTQTPPHHMLGLSSNMQAESLAAVEAGLTRKAFERKTNIGESHEQLLRLDAFIRGDQEESRMFDMQVRWRDSENRSLAQAADALGKLATQVEVPVQMLWEKYLPDWTDTDTARALRLIDSGAVDRLLDSITRQSAPNEVPDEETEPVEDESGL